MKKELFVRVERRGYYVIATIYDIVDTKYGDSEVVICSRSFYMMFSNDVSKKQWNKAWRWVIKQANDINIYSSSQYVGVTAMMKRFLI